MGFSLCLMCVRSGDGRPVDQARSGLSIGGKTHYTDGPWLVVTHGDAASSARSMDDPEKGCLDELSALNGEALCVVGQSNADQFMYEYSRGGKVVRKLVGDDGWRVVLGEPQPWEAPLLGPDKLAYELSLLEKEDDSTRLREIFAAKKFRIGDRYPRPGAGLVLPALKGHGLTQDPLQRP